MDNTRTAIIVMSEMMNDMSLPPSFIHSVQSVISAIVYKRAVATDAVAKETVEILRNKLGGNYDDLVNLSTLWYMLLPSEALAANKLYTELASTMLIDQEPNEPLPDVPGLSHVLSRNVLLTSCYVLSLVLFGKKR